MSDRKARNRHKDLQTHRVHQMTLLITRSTHGIRMQMKKKDLKSFSSKKKEPSTLEEIDMRLVPSGINTTKFSFKEWLDRYEHIVEEYIDELYCMMYDNDVIVKYNTFKQDMLHFMYNTSASKHRRFTFLGM